MAIQRTRQRGQQGRRGIQLDGRSFGATRNLTPGGQNAARGSRTRNARGVQNEFDIAIGEARQRTKESESLIASRSATTALDARKFRAERADERFDKRLKASQQRLKGRQQTEVSGNVGAQVGLGEKRLKTGVEEKAKDRTLTRGEGKARRKEVQQGRAESLTQQKLTNKRREAIATADRTARDRIAGAKAGLAGRAAEAKQFAKGNEDLDALSDRESTLRGQQERAFRTDNSIALETPLTEEQANELDLIFTRSPEGQRVTENRIRANKSRTEAVGAGTGQPAPAAAEPPRSQGAPAPAPAPPTGNAIRPDAVPAPRAPAAVDEVVDERNPRSIPRSAEQLRRNKEMRRSRMEEEVRLNAFRRLGGKGPLPSRSRPSSKPVKQEKRRRKPLPV